FFSSRRRHTRLSRDWSSDVCSADLPGTIMAENLLPGRYAVGKASVDAGGTVVTPKDATWTDNVWVDDLFFLPSQPLVPPQRIERSEERRVGEECGSRTDRGQ